MKSRQVIKYECERCKSLYSTIKDANECCSEKQLEDTLIRQHKLCPICKKTTEFEYCSSNKLVDITTRNLFNIPIIRTARYHEGCTTERTIVELISGCR